MKYASEDNITPVLNLNDINVIKIRLSKNEG